MESKASAKTITGTLDDGLESLDLPAIWAQVRRQVRPTTFIESARLDRSLGHDIRLLLVSETFQETGSFKLRAALAAALHSEASHLLTASSGNFGAGLARAAALTGKQCTVVMPHRSAGIKIESVREEGARVDLIDTDQTSRADRVAELTRQIQGVEVVSPYNDPRVIAGNGSLGDEIFEREVPDAIVTPVGGGGLSSGLVTARDRMAPATTVVGAEPALANDAARSLRAGELLSCERESNTLCDGARTLSLGKLNFQILRTGLAEIVEVQETWVADTVRWLFDRANLLVEPTGALALAAVRQRPESFAGQRVACIVSGGNVDPSSYARLLSETASRE